MLCKFGSTLSFLYFWAFVLFCLFFQLQQTLQKVILYKVFKAGSGSALRKQLDPNPFLKSSWVRSALRKQLDPDPQKINPAPQLRKKRLLFQNIPFLCNTEEERSYPIGRLIEHYREKISSISMSIFTWRLELINSLKTRQTWQYVQHCEEYKVNI